MTHPSPRTRRGRRQTVVAVAAAAEGEVAREAVVAVDAVVGDAEGECEETTIFQDSMIRLQRSRKWGTRREKLLRLEVRQAQGTGTPYASSTRD